MSYVVQDWTDTATSGTAITAERMNHIEQGIKDLDEFRDSISQNSHIWVFAISKRGSGTVQNGGNGTAEWNGTTLGGLIDGDDSYDNFMTLSSDKIFMTLNKPGIWRCRATIHASQTSSTRLGVGWFHNDVETVSEFVHVNANEAVSVSCEIVLKVEDPYKMQAKIFAGSKTFKKNLNGGLTNFTFEYMRR